MNPFFHFWVAARQKKKRPDESWREDPVFAATRGPQALEDLYANWYAAPNPAREVLRRQVEQLGPVPVRVFDLGCGFGQWLRYLRDECGVRAFDLFGCDFHDARVEAARTMLSSTACPLADALMPEQFFQADALNWDVEGFRARHGLMDLLTMFVVTGCFDDADLDRCLSIAARLEPRRILETTVTSSWDLWNGRSNSPDHFARAGYRLVESLRPGDPIASAGPLALVAPRKYWVANQINVYARDRS
jgi:SAM-dependent methyltransferase